MQNKPKFVVGPDDTKALPDDDYQSVPIVQASGDTLDETYREVVSFAETHNVSLARAAQHYLEPADDSDPDPVVDVLERNGVKLFGDAQGPATPTEPVFSNRALAAFATSYIQDCYFYQIHDAAFWRVGKPFVPAFQKVHHSQSNLIASFMKDLNAALCNIAEFAGGGDARSALPDQYNAFNPPEVGMAMPEKVLYQDLEIADITGEVREISGSKFTAPKVTPPKNYKLTGIGEFGSIPIWTTGLGEDQVETSKAGYGQRCSYEFLRTGGETMEGLAQFAMWLAFLTTAAIVDEGIALTMTSGGKSHAVGAATLDTKSAIKCLRIRRAVSNIMSLSVTWTSLWNTPARTLLSSLITTHLSRLMTVRVCFSIHRWDGNKSRGGMVRKCRAWLAIQVKRLCGICGSSYATSWNATLILRSRT